MYYSDVCFALCARVRRRTELEILSTRIRKGKSHNSKASHSVSTQREQAINYCRQKQRQTQQNPHNAKDDAETNNQAITSTLTRENA